MTEPVAHHDASIPEFPNIVSLIADQYQGSPFAHFLHQWEPIIYSSLAVLIVVLAAYYATRRRLLVPGRLQGAAEVFVSGVDDFVCSILGPLGRKYTPFIGSLFLYILVMNLMGLVPFFKSPTATWSNTMGLALVVFFYVQYTAFKELGFLGYVDHQMGKPRGIMALTVIMPVFLLTLHLLGELVRPISLSLRLHANIMAEEKFLAVFTGFGGVGGIIGGSLVYLFDILGAVIQAAVFSILTLIYFALVLVHEEGH